MLNFHAKYDFRVVSVKNGLYKINRHVVVNEPVECAYCGRDIEDKEDVTCCIGGKWIFHIECEWRLGTCTLQSFTKSLVHTHTRGVLKMEEKKNEEQLRNN